MKIISGSTCKRLSLSLSSALNCDYVEVMTGKFPDSELHVTIPAHTPDDHNIIVQSLHRPVNDNLIELLLIADAIKSAKSGLITAVIPYFGYSRQDHKMMQLDQFSAPYPIHLVAKLLKTAGIDRIITFDLHSSTAEQEVRKIFGNKFHNLSPHMAYSYQIRAIDDAVIVAPDRGAHIRAQNISDIYNSTLLVMKKQRLEPLNVSPLNESVAQISNIKQEQLYPIRQSVIFEGLAQTADCVYGKNCVIVDDIIDSGETICHSAELLYHYGAKSVIIFATHAVLSNNAKELVQNSKIASVYVTDTITHDYLPSKFRIITIKTLLAEFLKHGINDE